MEAIQYLCNYIKDKQILYLTYNKLLKVDAQSKIKGSNIEVNNYHGLAYKVLSEYGIRTSVSNLIQTINTTDSIRFKKYDILIIDEIVTDINIFRSNLFDKLILNEEELKVEEAYKKYKDNYIEKSFCEQMGCELKECDAIKRCEYASKNGCNVGCPYNKHEKRWIVLDDQNVIVSIVKSGFENMVTGKDKYNKPMYCSVDLEYDGISLACYLEYEEYTPTQAS